MSPLSASFRSTSACIILIRRAVPLLVVVSMIPRGPSVRTATCRYTAPRMAAAACVPSVSGSLISPVPTSWWRASRPSAAFASSNVVATTSVSRGLRQFTAVASACGSSSAATIRSKTSRTTTLSARSSLPWSICAVSRTSVGVPSTTAMCSAPGGTGSTCRRSICPEGKVTVHCLRKYSGAPPRARIVKSNELDGLASSLSGTDRSTTRSMSKLSRWCHRAARTVPPPSRNSCGPPSSSARAWPMGRCTSSHSRRALVVTVRISAPIG